MLPALRSPAGRSAAPARSRRRPRSADRARSASRPRKTARLTPSGGTLTLTGTVTSGTFAIAAASASVLEFSGTATIGAVTINNANQTLQVGAGGNLTITAAETGSLGKILMSGGT